jgi:SAM-dependent methyltransferase
LKPYADHFSRVASAYASARPSYPEELFSYLAGLVPRRDLAWDCAAGSGQASLPLTRFFRLVLASDISIAMLKQAAAHPRIHHQVMAAEASGLRSASVDLVTVAQALHWLDVDSFYSEVTRILLPGGALAVWTYGLHYLRDPAIDNQLAQFYRDTIGAYWAPERCHVDSGYRNLPFPFPELAPPRFAMVAEWSLPQLLGYIGTWSAVQRFRESQGFDPVVELSQELAQVWGPGERRRVEWPLSVRVGYRPDGH